MIPRERGRPARFFCAISYCVAIASALILSPAAISEQDEVTEEANAGKKAFLTRDFEGAQQHYSKAIAIGRRLSPETSITLYSNYGAALRACGKNDEAETAFKKAISIATAAKLTNSTSYISALKQYAALLRRTNQLEKAAELTKEANAAAAVLASQTSRQAANNTPQPSEIPRPKFDPATLGGNYQSDGKMTVADLMALAEKNNDLNLLKTVATILYHSKNYDACAPFAEKIAALEPNSAKNQSFLCSLYLDMEQPQKAINPALRALSLERSSDHYLNVIAAYSQAGDMKNHYIAVKEFLSYYPNDPEAPLCQHELVSLERALTQTDKNEFSKPTEEELRRSWAKRITMPIKVFLLDNTTSEQVLTKADGTGGQHPRELCITALQSWTSASNGRISFALVNDEASSNIAICYLRQGDGLLAENCAAGLTKWNPGYSRALVFLGLVGTDGYSIRRDKFFATVLHELGHALGLEHSNRPDDIMFWQEHAVQLTAPSNNDARRINALYE